MNRKKCVSGIFWTLFFLFFLYLDVQMGENASYWPGIIAKLGIALSLLSTLVSGMKWKSEKDEKLFPFTGAQLKRLGIALALLIIWVVCIRILGFLTSSVIVMAATGLIFELALSSKTVVRDLIVTVIFAVGMYALFTALGITFPKGILI